MRLLLTLLLLILTCQVNAQNIGSWESYPSQRSINGLVYDSDGVLWAATEGGLLRSDEGDLSSYTTLDGLSRLNSRSIGYNPDTNSLFLGYQDGTVDVFNITNESVTSLDDIRRATNFTSKSINEILIDNGRVYAATDFGIVVFDAVELLVLESYLQLGELGRAIAVLDISIVNGRLYAGTANGVAEGDLSNDLSVNTNWNSYDASNGFFDREISAISSFNSLIYASTTDANYIFDGNNWILNSDYGSNVIIDYNNRGNSLSALSSGDIYETDDIQTNILLSTNSITTVLARQIPDNETETAFGTAYSGIGVIDPGISDLQFQIQEGPFLNLFAGLNIYDNVLISGSTQRSSLNFEIDRARGYYIFRDGEWFNFNQLNTPLLRQTNFRQVFQTAETSQYYYFGSWGQGIVRHQKDNDEIYVFNETNSTLRGWEADSPAFPVMSGLMAENESDIWAVSRYGSTPLYYQQEGDDDWLPFPKNDAVNSSDEYFRLFIDSFGNKWVSLQSTTNSGTGLLIIDTGDPADPDDDRGEKLTSNPNDGNLPDEQVKVIIEDRNNEVWIGTERGISRFIFPELIIGGGVNEKRGQWLINADTSATSRFLLRDINVNAMAVNSANQKWIGSANQGIYILNEEGSEIIQRFTEENSPLISDNIQSITINDITGEVFIATDQGLQSYQGTPNQAVNSMSTLKVFPNPFAYSRNSQIYIENLSEVTTIRIMSIDGSVLNEISSRGGRTSWDGLDAYGNQLGSGVYFVVALSEDGSEKGIGKVVIIR